MHLVFVYGTLKRGHGNYHLLEASTYIGQALTMESFTLYGDGIPYCCREGHAPLPVRGELYRVSDEALARLDRLEGVPHHYQRTTVLTISPLGFAQDAFIYTKDKLHYKAHLCPVKDGAYYFGELSTRSLELGDRVSFNGKTGTLQDWGEDDRGPYAVVDYDVGSGGGTGRCVSFTGGYAPTSFNRLGPPMSEDEKRLARHALGLPNEKRVSFRNRYIAPVGGPAEETWRAMVERRFAEPSSLGTGSFVLTIKGAMEAIEEGEALDREDFPMVAK